MALVPAFKLHGAAEQLCNISKSAEEEKKNPEGPTCFKLIV